MSTYVMSDIHGDYDKYITMLKKINFSHLDDLYILGDIIDRGEHGLKILRDMMSRCNVIPILGNHELMAVTVLSFLLEEVTMESMNRFDSDMMGEITNWVLNGGSTTIEEFRLLSTYDRILIMDYLSEFVVFVELAINNQEFLLVHAGLNGFEEGKDLNSYSIHDLVWGRTDYSSIYFRDKLLITGHTPTKEIWEKFGEKNKYEIFEKNNHIAIDCGVAYGGHLACICLETMEKFYV